MIGSTFDIYSLLFVLGWSFLIGVGVAIAYYRVTESERVVSERKGLIIGKKEKEEKKKNKHKDDEEEHKGFQLKKNPLQKLADVLFDELLAANIMMRAEEFAFIWVGLIFLPAAVTFLFFGNVNKFLPFICIVIGVFGPILYINRKKKKRVEQFENQLSDALLIICNCLKSGLTFAQAMENIAKEMDDPIGKEFQRSVKEMNFGANLEDALNGMLERIDSADLSLTVAAVNIQRQTGGNLSQILETISVTIRDRLKIKAEIRTITGQGRVSGTIIAVMPLVVSGLLMLVNPGYMTVFFETSTGHILLGVCVFLEVLGYTIIQKVVQVKY